MENQDIVSKLIREQDLICYYLLTPLDPVIMFQKYSEELNVNFSDLRNLIFENEEVLASYSVKNLVNLMASLSKKNDAEKIERLETIIIGRLESEKFVCESIETELLGMQVVHPINRFFNSLSKENLDKIKQDINERLKNIEGTEFVEFDSKLKTFSSAAGFLESIDNGVLNSEKLDVLRELVSENENILGTMNFCIFKDDIYRCGKDFIKVIAKFPNLSKQLEILSDNNPSLLSVIVEEIIGSESFQKDYEKIKSLIDYFTRNCFELDVSNLTPENRSDLIDWAIGKSRAQKFQDKVQVEYSSQYHESIMAHCDEKFSTTESLDEKKNLLLNKYLSVSLNEALNLMEEYPEDAKSDVNDFFSAIKKIINLETPEEVDELYANYTGVKLRQAEVLAVLSEVRGKYFQRYEDVLKETDTKLRNSDYEYIEYEGKRIKQLTLSGEFDLFVHSSDAGFVNEVKLANNSFMETWQKGKDASNHIISMSYINQDFMGCAPVHGNGVMYGFTNLESNKFGVMGKSDINTYSRKFGYDSKDKHYLLPEDMIDNARRVYTEVGVERQNTSPDYVIVFSDMSDTVKENACRAALEFGIPIVSADKALIRDEQIKRLDDLIKKFKETKDIGVLGEIFNKYETNVAGWLLNRSTSEKDETYTQEVDNSALNNTFKEKFFEISQVFSDYINGIQPEEVKGSPDLLRAMLIFLKENDKYRGTEEKKPISKTHMSFELSDFINQINAVLEASNMGEYRVDASNLPTEQEYAVLIQDVVKFALRTEQIDMQEVRAVDYEKERRSRAMRREGLSVGGGR